MGGPCCALVLRALTASCRRDMAGDFGHHAETQDVSRVMAEASPLPAAPALHSLRVLDRAMSA